MPVEMVGRDGQHRPYAQPGLLTRLELKAAQLQDDPIVRPELIDPIEHRLADVAAPHHAQTPGAKHLGSERGGCGRAIGAGDAGDRTRTGLEEQVDLTGDWQTLFAG